MFESVAFQITHKTKVPIQKDDYIEIISESNSHKVHASSMWSNIQRIRSDNDEKHDSNCNIFRSSPLRYIRIIWSRWINSVKVTEHFEGMSSSKSAKTKQSAIRNESKYTLTPCK